MRAQIETIFAPSRRLERTLEFESALARALARVGIVSKDVAATITAQCDVARFDVAEIARAGVEAGNDVIPTVERLRSLVATQDPVAAAYVHWGATSQDAIDTSLVLQLCEALPLFDVELTSLADALGNLAMLHAATPMAGRTWMQHAAPTTFGLKAAGWLDAVQRHQTRISTLTQRIGILQFGGSVGTLAALGDNGPRVAEALAEELSLQLPVVPWHAARDRMAEVATTLALLDGTLGKIARDISLLAQSEIGELREPAAPGRGRSSTMPHKRNPVGCATVLAASIRAPGLTATILSAMVQEHERGLGGWQAEWETLPQLCVLSYEALSRMTAIVAGLEVDAHRMARNIDATNGLIFSESASFALIPRMGRGQAMAAVERAMRRTTEEGVHLRDALLSDLDVRAHLPPQQIEDLFDPAVGLRVAAAMARAAAAKAMIPRKNNVTHTHE